MKRVVFASLMWIATSMSVNAQVFTSEDKTRISEAKKQMDQNELGQMTEAETNFEEAQFALESVSSEEYKVEQDLKKSASSKNEKKAVNVKRTKVDASKKNEKGFTGMYEAMESRLGKIPFNPDNKQKVKDLRAQAADKMAAGTSAIEDYKFRDDKDLETYPYATLKEKTGQANEAFKEAIMLELRSFELFHDQTLSVINPSAETSEPASQSTDNSAVTVSTSSAVEASSSGVSVTTEPTSTTASSQSSSAEPVAVASNPEPVTVSSQSTESSSSVQVETSPIVPASVTVETSAPQPVAEVAPTPVNTSASVSYSSPQPVSSPKASVTIAPKSKRQAVAAPSPKKTTTTAAPQSASIAQLPQSTGVTYRIQIIAVSRGPLSDAETKKLYSGSEKVYVEQEGGFYKYMIGDFTSSAQAQRLKESISGDSFVVKYRDGKRQ